jgi:PKD repeat protein
MYMGKIVMKGSLSLLFLAALFCLSHAQNLVPNYSFETISFCPNGFGGIGPTVAIPWTAPTGGSPDIFNVCSTTFVDVPANFFGNQNALTGDGYAGIYCKLNGPEYREYIQAPLLEPLVAGEWYTVSFYVSPGDIGCGIMTIGAYLSVNQVTQGGVGALILSPQIESNQGFLVDYDNWTLISGCFQASGGEQYITLGNFNSDANTSFDPNCTSGLAYYYIEDVLVESGAQPENILFDLEGPETACFSYEIDPGIPDYIYIWEDGSNDQTLVVTESGTYSLTLTDGCNYGIDSIEVIINGNFDPIDLGPADLVLCNGDEYPISLDPDLSEYEWQDGSNSPEYTITTSGTYSVTLDDGCAVSTDEINIFFLDPPAPFAMGEDTILCAGDEIELSFDASLGDFVWQDGSSSSTYVVNEGGTYAVTISNMCGEESDEIIISDLEVPEVEIGPDEISICDGEILEIEIDVALGEILWQDGNANPNYEITQPGFYTVFVTNACGTGSDQLDVTVVIPPLVNLGQDTTLCQGEVLLLSTDQQGPFMWQDNSTADTFLVTSPGAFSLSITNICGTASDAINVAYNATVTPPGFGPDLSLCPGEQVILYANNLNANYLWQDGSMADSLVVTTSGTYTLEVYNTCSSERDTIVVIVNDNPPQVNLPDQLTLCQGQTLTLDAAISGVSFLWNDNSSNQQLAVSAPGTFSVTVTNACGVDVDTTIILDGGPAPVVDIGNDLQICAGDVIPLSPSFSNVDAWLWNDASTLPSFTVSTAGMVSVQVNNTCGVAFDTMIVSLLPATPPLDLGPDTSLCAW